MLSNRKADISTAQEHPESHGDFSQSERALLCWYRRLDEQERAHVLRFVSAMAMTTITTTHPLQ